MFTEEVLQSVVAADTYVWVVAVDKFISSFKDCSDNSFVPDVKDA